MPNENGFITTEQLIGRALDHGVELGPNPHTTIEDLVQKNLIPRLINGMHPDSALERLITINKLLKEGKNLDEIKIIIAKERRSFLNKVTNLSTLVDAYKSSSKGLLVIVSLATLIFFSFTVMTKTTGTFAREALNGGSFLAKEAIKPVGTTLAAVIRTAKNDDPNSTDPLGLTNINKVITINERHEVIIQKTIVSQPTETSSNINLNTGQSSTSNAGTGPDNVLLLDTLGAINIAGDIKTSGTISGDASGLTNLPLPQTLLYSDQTYANPSWLSSLAWAKLTSRPNILSSIKGVSNDGGDVDLVAGAGITITPNDTNNTITFSATGGSSNADLLDSLDSTQFLRSDTATSYTAGTLTLNAGTTLNVLGTFICSDCVGDAAIPNSITASNYLPLTGGAITATTATALTLNLTSSVTSRGVSIDSNNTNTDDIAAITNYGLDVLSRFTGTGGSNKNIVGINSEARFSNSGIAPGYLYGLRTLVSSTAGANFVVQSYGIDVRPASWAGDVPTLTYGINISNQGAAGATLNYSLYVAGATGAATNYSLYLADGAGTPSTGITFAGDTNLYRSAASILKTDSGFNVAGHGAFGGNASINANRILHVDENFTGSGSFTGELLNAFYTGTDTFTILRGLTANADWQGGVGSDASAVVGAQIAANQFADTAITSLKGLDLSVGSQAGASGAITTATGANISKVWLGAVPTTVYGVNIGDFGNPSTTTSYGLFLDDQTGSTTSYALYSVGGLAYFGGKLTASGGSTSAVGLNLNTAQAGPSCASLSNGDFGYDSSNTRIYWKGTGGTCSYWNRTGTFDIAEHTPATEAVEPGDIIAIDTTAPTFSVKKSNSAYQQTILGIESTDPSLISNPDKLAPSAFVSKLALAGRVPTKVSSENGPIQPGDPITSSSKAGVGMKATTSGPIVGRALESFTGGGEGKILVFVNPGWSGSNDTDQLNQLVSNLSANSKYEWKNSLGQTVAWVSNLGEAAFAKVSATIGNFQTLVFGELKVKSDSKIAGDSSIAEDTTEIFVPTDKVSANSLINITATSEPDGFLYVKEKSAGQGFTVAIKRSGSSANPVNFTWLIINKD